MDNIEKTQENNKLVKKTSTEISEQFQNNIKEYCEQMSSFAKKISSIIFPAIEEIKKVAKIFNETILPSINQLKPLFNTITLFGDNQYVYWDFLDDELISKINNAKKADSILNEISSNSVVNKIIAECRKQNFIKNHILLFNEVVESFRSSKYNLCILGICSLIDGALSAISENFKTKIKTRAEIIAKKLEESNSIENDEYGIVCLLLTFRKFYEVFDKPIDFAKIEEEPKGLNRHWIMHGRRTIPATKLDCIKLLRFLRSIFLIKQLSDQKEDTNE